MMEKGVIYKFFPKTPIVDDEIWYARFLEISNKYPRPDGEARIVVSGAICTNGGIFEVIKYLDFSEGPFESVAEIDKIVPCDEEEIALYEQYEKNKDL